jgi:curved DNA-binding protein CbpA
MATPTREQFLAWLSKVDRKSYYDLLRVKKDVTAEALKQAFHDFALACHPDRFVDEPEELARTAAEAFKRGAEAYRVLSRRELRERYDKALARGKLRLDDKSVDTVPPPPQGKTLEMVATTRAGKEHCIKADRFLSVGKLEEARLALTNAVQAEPHNTELSDRLKLIYEALALEPL